MKRRDIVKKKKRNRRYGKKRGENVKENIV